MSENLDYKLLLDISTAIASVRDRDELLALIVDRVQPIFGFNQYTNIAVYNSERDTLQMFFTKMSGIEQTASEIGQFMQAFPVTGIFQAIIETDEVLILDESWKTSPKTAAIDEASAQIWRDLDFKYALSIRLSTFGKVVGTFHVHFFEPQNFSEAELALFKAVADMIAVAVANILANEEILKREQEKTLLLSLSGDVSLIRDKKDLFRVITEKIKPSFKFDDAYVSVTTKDGNHHRVLMSMVSPESEESSNYHIIHKTLLPNYEVYRLTTEKVDPILFTIEEIAQSKLQNEIAIKYHHDGGMKYNLGVSMQHAGQTIGAMFFSARENIFPAEKFGLYKNLSNQVAVAVANILANEEILEREREKSDLLEISEQIAITRSFDDLFAVVTDRLQPLFGFADFVLAVLSKDKTKYRPINIKSVSEQSERGCHSTVKENFNKEFNNSEDVWITGEKIFERAVPYYYTVDELLEKYPDYFWAKMMRETGILSTIAKTLQYQGEILGGLFIHFDHKLVKPEIRYSLIEGIANQFAPAVANILANEEISEREQEKSLLLSIGEDMATIRDRDALFRTIIERLRPKFGFQTACVTTYSDDLTHYRHLLIDPSPKLLEHQFYKQLVGDFFLPIADTPDSFILERFDEDDLYYWHTAEMAARYPNHPVIPLLLDSDLRHNIHVALRYQNRIIGFFHIHYTDLESVDESRFGLLRSIAKQMAVAVANILANEDILKREREKALLLSISGDIAAARTSVELLQVVRDKAQLLISFHDTGILIVEPGGKYHYDLAVNIPGWDDSAANILLQAAELNRIPHKNSYLADVMKLMEQADAPIIHDWAAAFEQAEHPFFEVVKEAGYKESIACALKSGGETFGTLWLNSLEKNHFSSKQFEIFQALANQVAVAVSNILANAEVARLAEERHRRADELARSNEAVARASEWLTALPDLSAFLEQVLIEAAKQLGADAGQLTVFDETSNTLHTKAVVEANRLVEIDKFNRKLQADEAEFWRILRETRRPRFFNVEDDREADLFWSDVIEYHKKRRHKSVLAIPLFAGDKPLGHLGLAFKDFSTVDAERAELVTALANQAALAIQLTRLADEAERAATLAERNRIAREIHDSLAQGFTGVILQLETAKRVFGEATPAKVAEHVLRSIELAREGLREARRSVQTLRPADDDSQLDLAFLLQEKLVALTFDTEIKTEFSTTGESFEMAPETLINLLRIGQEAITNALRHAAPRRITVELDYRDDGLRLRVADDGAGFEVDDKKQYQGYGLKGMRERAAAVKADLQIRSTPGAGTIITATFAVNAATM